MLACSTARADPAAPGSVLAAAYVAALQPGQRSLDRLPAGLADLAVVMRWFAPEHDWS